MVKQHPLPFSKHEHAVKARPHDLALDAAHFATLYANGCSEAAIADAIERQRARQETDSFPTWSRTFTTYLALATEATSLWGCTGLTWDTQYRHYVSASEEDVGLGATQLQGALHSLLDLSVILLDAFDEVQQASILGALVDRPGVRCVVVARQGFGFGDLTKRLQQLGTHTEELLPGQTLAASADG